MAGVLCLDLSSHVGWAFGALPARPLTPLEMAVRKPPKPESGVAHFLGPLGEAIANFEAWLTSMFQRLRPSGVIFESPILPKKTTPTAVRKLMSLAGIAQMVCHRFKIRWIREAQPSRVKVFICGDGSPGKVGVMNAIRSFGWCFEDDNEADGLALFVYAADLYAAERRARAA